MRLEQFALKHGIDRTSAIKLALHYYLNLKLVKEAQKIDRNEETLPDTNH